MSGQKRISKSFYITNGSKRGSLWSLWLKPVQTGPNDIYFAGSGFKTELGKKFGFNFHLSIHKDGRCHVKDVNNKIHKFSLAHPENFSICSVYTHLEDLTVPLVIPRYITGDILPIASKSFTPSDTDNWSEIYFVHLEQSKISSFLQLYTNDEYNFSLIDTIDIGQGRSILVLFRYITSAKIENLSLPKPSQNLSETNRLTVWSQRTNNSNHIVVYDFSAINTERISQTMGS